MLVELGVSLESGAADSHMFLPHLAPLTLACIKNDFTIVRLFLGRGLQLPSVHLANCLCKECGGKVEDIEGTLRRLDTFRAYASAAYLFLGSHDPFLLAADLCNDLGKCMDIEVTHKVHPTFLSSPPVAVDDGDPGQVPVHPQAGPRIHGQAGHPPAQPGGGPLPTPGQVP